ncbi:MAG: hypothetical protein HY231_02715 [Acidobacteria bacterium]|nr:hypothetical protein [Acidobacteriota bacterium]
MNRTKKFALAKSRAALIIAHPGHELRVYHWLTVARPVVFILTDGSGHTGKSRLATTTQIVEASGSAVGSIYGRMSDRMMYSAIINHEYKRFIALVEELAQSFMRASFDYVVGDAIEGYNPTHDVCRLLINAALELAKPRLNHAMLNYEILLTGEPDDYAEARFEKALWLELNNEAWQQKLAAARGYPELAAEVDGMLKQSGRETLRRECLRPVEPGFPFTAQMPEPPYYERYGEQRVAAGYFQTVLRYRDRMLPLAEALAQYVSRQL